DFKRALKADRLSCKRFWANQFGLLLHAAAYWLMVELRRKLVEAGVGRMQLDTLRLRLFKIGGRVHRRPGAPVANQGALTPRLGTPGPKLVGSPLAGREDRS
ncbi:MAG TPA: transposase, partial [Rubrobacter sp.]|nr:transposase [Rubrobacter sp.]